MFNYNLLITKVKGTTKKLSKKESKGILNKIFDDQDLDDTERYELIDSIIDGLTIPSDSSLLSKIHLLSSRHKDVSKGVTVTGISNTVDKARYVVITYYSVRSLLKKLDKEYLLSRKDSQFLRFCKTAPTVNTLVLKTRLNDEDIRFRHIYLSILQQIPDVLNVDLLIKHIKLELKED
jgi:hypothetical protein